MFDLEEITSSFLGLILTNKLYHAWAFCGFGKVPKIEIARFLALNIVPTESETLFLPRNFQEKKSKTISIEEVRDLVCNFYNTASVNYKVAIINDAHNLTYQASNSLLNILEEPRPNTLIFLLVDSAAKILPTIKSRCYVINLIPPSKEEFRSEIMKRFKNLTNHDIKALQQSCCDNVEIAIQVIESGNLDILNKIHDCFVNPNYTMIEKIISFASLSKENWELVKIVLKNRLHEQIIAMSAKKMAYRFIEKIQNSIYNLDASESFSLDKSKVISLSFRANEDY